MKIKKMYQGTVPENKILNTQSDSQTDVYSCDYVNKLNTYSTEEKVIGTWMDKPLYGKTIIFNTSYNTQYEFSHGIENYDKVWIDFGDSYYLANNGVTVPLNANSYYGDFTQTNDAMVYQDKIILYSTGGWNENWEKVITIKYTKTTD